MQGAGAPMNFGGMPGAGVGGNAFGQGAGLSPPPKLGKEAMPGGRALENGAAEPHADAAAINDDKKQDPILKLCGPQIKNKNVLSPFCTNKRCTVFLGSSTYELLINCQLA